MYHQVQLSVPLTIPGVHCVEGKKLETGWLAECDTQQY